MGFEGNWWTEDTILNLRRQFEEVHYLGDPSPRNPLSGHDFGLVELGILVHLLTPHQRQLKRMRTPLVRLGFFLLLPDNLLDDIGRKGNGGANERGRSPPGKGYPECQAEVPGSSDSTLARGANSHEFRTYSPDFLTSWK
jgi:hypothetical protein